jgi:hypothetical protein
MKRIVSIITIFLVLFLLTFSINVNAETLNSLDIQITKQTVNPEENVTVNVQFGENLGAYTVEVAYDSNLFEYVSADGGTANDTGSKVIVAYHDSTGGSNSRNSMSVTFKAKDVTTSNPTEFNVTLKGLANADATITYDDITTPITKSITVEPVYVDYTIALNYTGNIIKNEEKDMEIVISSTMGKNYEHTRIIAEAVTPSGETVKLLATDSQSLEHDIIQSGWGDDQGDSIGGKNVTKKISARGIFSGVGDYSITLKLINRDDSDAVIASKTFNISVGETKVENNVVENNVEVPPTNETQNVQAPSTLPKTGSTIYFVVIPILAILVVVYVVLRKRD